MTIAAPSSADARGDHKTAARDSHPTEAATLEGLLAEVGMLEMMFDSCSDGVCDDLRQYADEVETQLATLWPVVADPEGKRDAIDDVYKAIDGPNTYLDAFIPQSGLPELDAVMREWSATKERIDRFKRSLRQLAEA